MKQIFWYGIMFVAGVAAGVVADTLMYPPCKPAESSTDCQRNGWTVQVEDGVAYTSHVPALDECPEAR